MLPPELKGVFWDVRFEELDVSTHRDLIVGRVVEYGTDAAVRWLRATYKDPEIAEAIENERPRLSERSLGLWRLWLHKPEDWCKSTPSRPLKGKFWRS